MWTRRITLQLRTAPPSSMQMHTSPRKARRIFWNSLNCAPYAIPQFNLDVEEVESAARELDSWKRDIAKPLVIEVWFEYPKALCGRVLKVQRAATRCLLTPFSFVGLLPQILLQPWGASSSELGDTSGAEPSSSSSANPCSLPVAQQDHADSFNRTGLSCCSVQTSHVLLPQARRCWSGG
jgi:hypothetical protein